MAVNRAQVLILGVPGRMQDSLRTLLRAVPELDIVGAKRDCRPLVNGGSPRPDLVVLDFGAQTAEVTRHLAWIRAHWPTASCLVVADTVRQLLAAKAAGAHGVLLRGFAAGEFFGMLRDLLNEQFRLGLEPARPSGAFESSPSLKEGRALLASPAVY